MATRPKGRATETWIAAVMLSFFGPWMMMFFLGVVHLNYAEGVPALGYWDTFLLFILIELTLTSMLFGLRVKVLD